jgi:hypothetical protein
MSKHNPKLNPNAPYKDDRVWALPLEERRKVAVSILHAAIRDTANEPPHARAIRKACNLTARQFRKAVREVRETE